MLLRCKKIHFVNVVLVFDYRLASNLIWHVALAQKKNKTMATFNPFLAVVNSNPFLECIVYMEGIFSPRKIDRANSSSSGKCSQCESSDNTVVKQQPNYTINTLTLKSGWEDGI